MCVQKLGSGEMTDRTETGAVSTGTSTDKRPDAYVYCVAEPSVVQPVGSAAPPSVTGPPVSPAASSIALDGPSLELDESSRVFSAAGGVARFGPSASLHESGSTSAMTGVLGMTARERLYILSAGTCVSPRRGIMDAPLPDDALLRSSSQRLSCTHSAQTLTRSNSAALRQPRQAVSAALPQPAQHGAGAAELAVANRWTHAQQLAVREPISEGLSACDHGQESLPASQAGENVGQAVALGTSAPATPAGSFDGDDAARYV